MFSVAVAHFRTGSQIYAPFCRLAHELAGLSGWRRYGVAFLLGVSAAAALPPVDLSPLLVLAFPGVLWLDEGSSCSSASFGLGYAFGFGFFAAGLYWVSGALFVDIAAFWWLVPIAALGLPAALSLYTGIVFLTTNIASKYLRLSKTARVFGFAITWTSAWIRGHAFTGLPWNLIGSTWSGGFPGAIAILQCVAWVGIYGLSFITVLAVSLPALVGGSPLVPISARRRWAPAIAAVLLVAIPGFWGALQLQMSPITNTKIWLRVVQPSIPQTMKWEPGAAETQSSEITQSERRAITLPARCHCVAGGSNTLPPRTRRDGSTGDCRDRPRQGLSNHRCVAGEPIAGAGAADVEQHRSVERRR